MTIEERIDNVKKQYVYPNFPNCSEDYLNGFETGYIICSKEQDPISRADERKKVIKRACEWLKNNTPLGCWSDRMEEFKQAMEE